MSKTTRRLWCALAATGLIPLLHGCSGGSGSALEEPEPQTTAYERIVFVRPLSSGVAGPVWISETDGKNPVRLTNGSDSQPVISGRIIAFIRDNQLWTINVDGSNLKQITTGSALTFRAVADPAWNASGTQIAFAAQKTAADFFHVYVYRFRDNRLLQVTGQGENPNTSINPPSTPGTVGETESTSKFSNEFDPEWAPDGEQIAFATDRHVRRNPAVSLQKTITELYKINLDNEDKVSNLTRLTKHDFTNGIFPTVKSSTSTGNPVFSLDGNRILFESQDVNFNVRQLYSIPTNGRALTTDKWTAYTSDTVSSSSPAISTDGKTVVWSRGGKIVSAPGGNAGAARVLTDGIQPSWGLYRVEVTPTPAPTTRPTATTPPSSGNSLAQQSFFTLKREANGSVSRFDNQGITGDHEADNGGAIQTLVTYSLSSIPSGATINSATLDLAQTPRDGDPFGNLGPSYVELASSAALNEGALSSGARPISTTRVEAASVDITALLRQAVAARQSQITLRLRFRDVKNNNRQNDNMNNVFGLIRYNATR